MSSMSGEEALLLGLDSEFILWGVLFLVEEEEEVGGRSIVPLPSLSLFPPALCFTLSLLRALT